MERSVYAVTGVYGRHNGEPMADASTKNEANREALKAWAVSTRQGMIQVTYSGKLETMFEKGFEIICGSAQIQYDSSTSIPHNSD